MPIEKVLVEDGVVVAQRLCQPGQPRRRDLLQGGLVRLVADAATVEDAPVLRVHLASSAAPSLRRRRRDVSGKPHRRLFVDAISQGFTFFNTSSCSTVVPQVMSASCYNCSMQGTSCLLGFFLIRTPVLTLELLN